MHIEDTFNTEDHESIPQTIIYTQQSTKQPLFDDGIEIHQTQATHNLQKDTFDAIAFQGNLQNIDTVSTEKSKDIVYQNSDYGHAQKSTDIDVPSYTGAWLDDEGSWSNKEALVYIGTQNREISNGLQPSEPMDKPFVIDYPQLNVTDHFTQTSLEKLEPRILGSDLFRDKNGSQGFDSLLNNNDSAQTLTGLETSLSKRDSSSAQEGEQVVNLVTTIDLDGQVLCEMFERYLTTQALRA